ncbi:MAG TPA: class I SAM-dependent methyltransferase [Geminicoccaceae bacterium]
MSLYERRILPGLIDLAMRQKRLAPLREALVGEARGRVLDLGIGPGLNLPLYRRDLEEVVGIDPSPELLRRARRHTAWTHFPVRLHQALAEDLPLDSGSIDTVVMTWTLCSVGDPARALAEVRRVLRPGGALLFIEHGRAERDATRRWQDRLTPLWRRVAGGCHLNRAVDRLVEGAGFALERLETGHLVAGPKVLTYHYRGRAVVA